MQGRVLGHVDPSCFANGSDSARRASNFAGQLTMNAVQAG